MQQEPSTYSFLTINSSFCKDIDSNEVKLCAGHRNSNVLIQCEDLENSSGVNIGKQLGQRLHIPSGKYRVIECEGTNIRIGPIVGILSSNTHKQSFARGRRGRVFKELFDRGINKGLFIYRFGPEDVDLRRKLIKGYTYNTRGYFYSDIFTMPDIVYNRIRYRDIERRPDTKRLLRYFDREPGIYLFNSRFLNKIEVYRALIQDKQSLSVVPETALLSFKTLKYFLGKYGEVYIKPMANSLGHGIVKVKRKNKETYHVQFAKSTRPNILFSLNQVYFYLKHSGIHPSSYLIQKGIDLASYQGRIFDLRAQVQKDINGEWILTGVGIRVAGPNKIVTHIPNGGSAKAYDQVIEHVFGHIPGSRGKIDDQLGFIAKLIPAALNRRLPVELAILSMDIGLDRNGKLWLIEVNSKPSYFDEHNIRAVHTKTLVDYFIFSAINNLGGRE